MTSRVEYAASTGHRKRKMRGWFALPAALLGPGMMFAAYLSETYYRFWIYAAAPFLSVGLLALWWCLIIENTWRKKRRRILIVLAVTLCLCALAFGLLRPGKSHDGTSLPSLEWRWSGQPRQALTPATAPRMTDNLSIERTPSLPEALDCLTFLGPARDGRIPQVELHPDWNTTKPQILWRQPIGLGWAACAVSGVRVITLEQQGEDEWVSCYHLASGDLLWKHCWRGERFSESMGGDGPRSTPTIHGPHVFTLGGTGILACLELANGKLLWQRNILQDAAAPNLTWATTASPLATDNLVIVPGGNGTGPELLAYSQESGAEIWRTGSAGGTYSSPRIVELHGRPMVLNVHGYGVAGYDPATGEKLWNYPWGNNFPKVAQPLAWQDDKVLITASYNQGSHLFRIAADQEGSLSAERIWESRRMKTKFSSASIIDNHLYGLDEGTFACVDLADGDRIWKDGRYGFGQHLVVGSHILLLSERGTLVLLEPTPEGHRELASMEVLRGKCWAAPTLAGVYCLLRSETEITCLQLPGRILPP